MAYSINEIAVIIGVAPSTIRFYDKKGMLPFIERTGGGIRRFAEKDYEWLRIIECLKTTGMSLTDIKEYIYLAIEGDTTLRERYDLILHQKESIEKQIADLSEMRDTLAYKSWNYETSIGAGTHEIHENDTVEDIPQELRSIYLKLKIRDK